MDEVQQLIDQQIKLKICYHQRLVFQKTQQGRNQQKEQVFDRNLMHDWIQAWSRRVKDRKEKSIQKVRRSPRLWQRGTNRFHKWLHSVVSQKHKIQLEGHITQKPSHSLQRHLSNRSRRPEKQSFQRLSQVASLMKHKKILMIWIIYLL